MKTEDIKSITIIGRRWFDRTYGNTYHSVTALIDGEAVYHNPFNYGYGDNYQYTAWYALIKQGLIDAKENDTPWYWCDKHGIKLFTSVSDVQRKKDL